MYVLEAKNITKIFPGITALDDVSISFKKEEIHCVIGENGAGKSTLIKCLTGVYVPEEGGIMVCGEDARKNPELFSHVAYVPQEIDLFEHMTVAENLFIPYERSGLNGLVDQKQIEKMAVPLLEKFRIPVSPDDVVKDISISSKQLLQIARATANREYDAIILDEPTTSLTSSDTLLLFEIIRELKKEKKAVVFISHKLEEIFALGDVLTVFRSGKHIAYDALKNVDVSWIIRRMMGKEFNQEEEFLPESRGEEILLQVNHLWGEKFADISFFLKRGEILGFSGLVGSGRSELMQAIFGYLPVYSGEILFEGEPWKLGDTSYSVKKGLIYLPEERKKQGILPLLSLRENVSILSLDSFRGKVTLSTEKEERLAQEIIEQYDIRTSDMEKEIRFLSGGNQQKAIIGRSMSAKPKVLIFDEPTKGIDVGTKAEIYRLMRELAQREGIGIILISSELEEVKKCSNRIITLYRGKKSGEYDASADKERVLEAMIGMGQEKGAWNEK